MQVSYKLKASEINQSLMNTIKELFKGKEVTITVTPEPDETSFLVMSAENEKHLMDSIAQEAEIRFTPSEFKETVKNIKAGKSE